ncbi:MAG: hypothetical protein M3214_11000 [Actinomycetota bacterium]|nr:hypothetical protein [Actinomycetota bacterium]
MTEGGGAEGTDIGVLDHARQRLGLSVEALWIQYFGLGGTASRAELEAIMAGALALDRRQYDVIAAALNDLFADRGEDHPVPYRRS